MTSRFQPNYPSDLTDQQWDRLQEALPESSHLGRQQTISLREVANAISYRWETGCAWRMLPHDFPKWGTVYSYFRNWQRTGVIRQLRQIILEPRPKKRRFRIDDVSTRWNTPAHTDGFSSPTNPVSATNHDSIARVEGIRPDHVP